MKKGMLFALLISFLAACTQDNPSVFSSGSSKAKPTLLMDGNTAWQYEKIRLYPIVADVAARPAEGSQLTTLSEAMSMPGFRVTELKNFGRTGRPWYNGLTVQNKTQDTIYIMSGDVVSGGNQDRVFAHEDIVLPGTVKNMEVFCVESGRSHYYDSGASESEKQVAAFKGYYNVASPQVRQAINRTGNQSEVWSAVAKVTEANDAESTTHAYTALETENEKKKHRDDCLQHFSKAFEGRSDVVGVVVVAGDQVLGVDIFGSPGLFKSQFSALMHGYVADALNMQNDRTASDDIVRNEFEKVVKLSDPTEKPGDSADRYALNGHWVHLFRK